MIFKHSESNFREILDGIRIKTLVYGEKTLMVQFLLKKGSILPSHSHPFEQTGYLISGRIVLYIGEKSYEMKPGDGWCIPENIQHKAEIGEDSVALEVFSPAREDYIQYFDKGSAAE